MKALAVGAHWRAIVPAQLEAVLTLRHTAAAIGYEAFRAVQDATIACRLEAWLTDRHTLTIGKPLSDGADGVNRRMNDDVGDSYRQIVEAVRNDAVCPTATPLTKSAAEIETL